MRKKENKDDRPEAYPKPSEADRQLKDQPEFIDQEPNEFTETQVRREGEGERSEQAKDDRQ